MVLLEMGEPTYAPLVGCVKERRKHRRTACQQGVGDSCEIAAAWD